MNTRALQEVGFQQISLELPEEVEALINEENYEGLDRCLNKLLSRGGLLYQALLVLTPIHQIEHLIAIREGESDEEGIWHDDGSRDFAFTLSLVLDLEQLEGGVLLFRKKGEPESLQSIPTAPYGTLTILKTGKAGYEHRVQKVTRGRRIICVGWVN